MGGCQQVGLLVDVAHKAKVDVPVPQERRPLPFRAWSKACQFRWSRVNECNSGPPKKFMPHYPEETIEMVKLVSHERVQQSVGKYRLCLSRQKRPSRKSKLLFRSVSERSELSKCPRSQKCGGSQNSSQEQRRTVEQYLVSAEVDFFRSGFLRGRRDQISRKHLQCCLKLGAWMY